MKCTERHWTDRIDNFLYCLTVVVTCIIRVHQHFGHYKCTALSQFCDCEKDKGGYTTVTYYITYFACTRTTQQPSSQFTRFHCMIRSMEQKH
jgi:hypothetical protein